MHRQRHRNAAHAQAGHEGGDVHPQVREDGQQHRGPYQRAQPPGHERGRGTDLPRARGAMVAPVALDPQTDGARAPQPQLHRHGQEPELAHTVMPTPGQVQHAGAHQQCRQQDEQTAGSGEHLRQQACRAGIAAAGFAVGMRDGPAQQQRERQVDAHGRGRRRQYFGSGHAPEPLCLQPGGYRCEIHGKRFLS